MVDAHQRACKTHFSRNDSAQLSFHNFVDAQHAVFHGEQEVKSVKRSYNVTTQPFLTFVTL